MEYVDLAIKMEKVIKDIPEGKDEIIDVAKGLIRKYPRGPAMIEKVRGWYDQPNEYEVT